MCEEDSRIFSFGCLAYGTNRLKVSDVKKKVALGFHRRRNSLTCEFAFSPLPYCITCHKDMV